jgi:hypothetical protein
LGVLATGRGYLGNVITPVEPFEPVSAVGRELVIDIDIADQTAGIFCLVIIHAEISVHSDLVVQELFTEGKVNGFVTGLVCRPVIQAQLEIPDAREIAEIGIQEFTDAVAQ